MSSHNDIIYALHTLMESYRGAISNLITDSANDFVFTMACILNIISAPLSRGNLPSEYDMAVISKKLEDKDENMNEEVAIKTTVDILLADLLLIQSNETEKISVLVNLLENIKEKLERLYILLYAYYKAENIVDANVSAREIISLLGPFYNKEDEEAKNYSFVDVKIDPLNSGLSKPKTIIKSNPLNFPIKWKPPHRRTSEMPGRNRSRSRARRGGSMEFLDITPPASPKASSPRRRSL